MQEHNKHKQGSKQWRNNNSASSLAVAIRLAVQYYVGKIRTDQTASTIARDDGVGTFKQSWASQPWQDGKARQMTTVPHVETGTKSTRTIDGF